MINLTPCNRREFQPLRLIPVILLFKTNASTKSKTGKIIIFVALCLVHPLGLVWWLRMHSVVFCGKRSGLDFIPLPCYHFVKLVKLNCFETNSLYIWVEIGLQIQQLVQWSNQMHMTFLQFTHKLKLVVYNTNNLKGINSYKYSDQTLMMLLMEKMMITSTFRNGY